MSEHQNRWRDDKSILAVRVGWEALEYMQEHAGLVVQLPGAVLLCDPVAPTYWEAGKLQSWKPQCRCLS